MIDYIGNELELFQHAKHWKGYFSSYIKKYIKGDILEVGAGFGVNTRYLVNDSVSSWTFIEPDAHLADRIIEYTTELKILKKVIVGTLQNLECELYDTIIYIDVLEHIEASKAEIELIKKHLKPDGHLIILVPAYQYLFSEFDKSIGHFRRYNKQLLRSEVNSILKEKRLFYLDSCGVMASVANKLFLKKSAINLGQVKFWDRVLVNFSKISDQIVFKSFGKSLIGVYQNKN